MAAGIERLRTRQDRLRADQAAQLRQLVLAFAQQADRGLPERAVGEIVAAIDRSTASENGWTFVMISPAQHAAVVDYLMEHAHQPRLAARIWAACFVDMRHDTGEIMLTRAQIAERVGAPPREVSRVLALLVKYGALIRHRADGGVARFFMNSEVATHKTGADRDRAQAEAPPLGAPETPNNVAKLPRKTKHSGVVQV